MSNQIKKRNKLRARLNSMLDTDGLHCGSILAGEFPATGAMAPGKVAEVVSLPPRTRTPPRQLQRWIVYRYDQH
jgi:hypothetical protein